MDRQTLDKLNEWFSGYCKTFHTADPEDQRNITLKEEHTRRVCANMAAIAADEALGEDEALLAGALALFHDIGRFSQYRLYRTFQDSVSVNHAALGAGVLIENNVLGSLLKQEQNLITRAVTLHNVFIIPQGLAPDLLFFLKMVRDADKLDIVRIFIELGSEPAGARASAASLGLPETPGYSPEVLASLRRKELVRYSTLKTVNDFRLLQLAWIFDLNFDASLRMAAERRYIDRMSALLPDVLEIREALDFVREYAAERLRGG
jgi:hypothetical protein